mmetsp:Transcript_19561/g.28820  ORF Transcript_19561/g.28820 Transcript_19561/m.28820 type:complete len:85 (+) Transcript_19561:231-485(+)
MFCYETTDDQRHLTAHALCFYPNPLTYENCQSSCQSRDHSQNNLERLNCDYHPTCPFDSETILRKKCIQGTVLFNFKPMKIFMR